jgi:deazaflavin-dependent oxidoreductase (nitroreductase family)
VFGSRLLLLNHIGRVSGKRRQTILEVAERDGDSYVVASGWGSGAAWYRNILHIADVSIQVGKRTIPVTAIPLDKDDGGDVFVRYASRHRAAARCMLPRVLGYSVDGSVADFRAVGQHMPFVRFVPRTTVEGQAAMLATPSRRPERSNPGNRSGVGGFPDRPG